MADKLRSVNTKFWEDPFIEELSISEKLLFLYLLTNSQTNILGIYEISIKRISYDTGLNKETIQKGFERFGRVQKAYFIDNFVILPNFLKNQRLNANMKTGVAKIFNELPIWLKQSILGNDLKWLGNDSKGFETVLNGLVKYEIEIKKEEKGNIEGEIKTPSEKYFRKFAHLKISIEDNSKLLDFGYSQNQLNDIYDRIENYKQNTKYKSLYLTSKKWLEKEIPKNNNPSSNYEMSHEAFVNIPKERHSEVKNKEDEIRILTELYPEYGN